MMSDNKNVPDRKAMIIRTPQFDMKAIRPGQVVMFTYHCGQRKWSDTKGAYYAGIVNNVKAFELNVTFFSEASEDIEHVSITMKELLSGDFSVLNVSMLTDQDIMEAGVNPLNWATKYGHRFAVERDVDVDEDTCTL